MGFTPIIPWKSACNTDREARAALDGHSPDVPKIPAVMGPPTLWTEALADKIIEHLGAGMTFAAIGRLEDCPSRRTLYRWCRDDLEFAFDCARAERDHSAAEAKRMLDEMFRACREGVQAGTPQSIGEGETTLILEANPKMTQTYADKLQWAIECEYPEKYAPFRYRQVVAAPVAAIGNGDGAKLINPTMPPRVIESDPMHEAIAAWGKALATFK
jgi:hypothetical protein